jgi:flavin-dependent dehydrogenase
MIQKARPDVVIIGGGPAGSTVGSLLKKYRPQMAVLILEREAFPRDHVGESQLHPSGSRGA